MHIYIYIYIFIFLFIIRIQYNSNSRLVLVFRDISCVCVIGPQQLYLQQHHQDYQEIVQGQEGNLDPAEEIIM